MLAAKKACPSTRTFSFGSGVALKDGRINRGDLVMIEAMGGGFTWGSALVRM